MTAPDEALIERVTSKTLSSADDVARWIIECGAADTCAAGWAVRNGDGEFLSDVGGSTETLFDLASVTKPMTAVAFARSGIPKDALLGSWLAEARETPSESVPMELFLAHRAGLVDHVPLYLPHVTGASFDRAEALHEAALKRREDASGAPPAEGFRPVYSDLGYALVGEALARALGAVDAGAAIDALVVRPLALDLSLGTARELHARGVDVTSRAAPTEDVPWRGGVVRGVVHDENAWALTGDGGSGHAGMFGTAAAVLRFGCEVLAAHDLDWLKRERPSGTLRAGFDGKSAEGSSIGAVASAQTYGHLGFTGTSLWIDPEASAVVVLLTNRVHPTRNNTKIREARPRAHDALFTLARNARGSGNA